MLKTHWNNNSGCLCSGETSCSWWQTHNKQLNEHWHGLIMSLINSRKTEPRKQILFSTLLEIMSVFCRCIFFSNIKLSCHLDNDILNNTRHVYLRENPRMLVDFFELTKRLNIKFCCCFWLVSDYSTRESDFAQTKTFNCVLNLPKVFCSGRSRSFCAGAPDTPVAHRAVWWSGLFLFSQASVWGCRRQREAHPPATRTKWHHTTRRPPCVHHTFLPDSKRINKIYKSI